MSKAIRHALMIANFTIDRPALLEINRKIATMGGGRFSSCQKIGLSLFGVCLFFGGFWCIKKLGLPPEKKILAGRLGLDPLPTAAMAPHSRRRRMRQSARMLRDKTVSLKLKNLVIIALNFTF